jgi:hypothetical protein
MTAGGTVTLTDSVSSVGAGLFQNDLTIADGTGLLAVLDVEVPPVTAISGLAAPGGIGPVDAFQTAYDSGLGLVSFISNNSAFRSSSEAGLFFDSSVLPSGIFDITWFDGTTGSSAPEPSSLALFALGGGALLFSRKRLSLTQKMHYSPTRSSK